ncbi:MAG: ATP-dependent DNA helicase RecQ [Deltaproteobacteria bacterium]|nr:ATP-dependent DNA helicase RecQ [Deltaproteobacteria bacterium]
MLDPAHILQTRFGYPDFRPGQREIVEHTALGRDSLVVMPTGAGKSLCYQVPALARGGVTLVVSPLIALMKDQVDALVEKGIRASFLNSSLSTAEYRARSEAVARGEVELLYVAPERFSPRFLEFLKDVNVQLLAVDEAHCLSQWGHDFRPDYLRLGQVRQALGNPPTVALTATATPEVQADIKATLGLETARTFIQGFDRDNLILEVLEVEKRADKDAELAALITAPALVYAATRKNVERATEALRAKGIPAGMYHAGLSADQRNRVQDDFMAGRVPVVVATNAFGMGIDKADIRTIIHYDMPGTVEAYYQEIGRAGRDGRMSRAVLLHQRGDRFIHELFIKSAHPPADWIHKMYDGLRASGENPVFTQLELLANHLPPEGGDRAASACIYALVREGLVRRIAPSDRAAYVRVSAQPPAETPRGQRGKVWASLRGRGMGPGDSSSFHLDRWGEELDLTREQLNATLRGLEDRGYLRYQPAERVGGVELIDPERPLQLDEEALQVRRSHDYAKLAQMEAYLQGGCRRRFVVEYFGEKAPFDRCGTCDVCRAEAVPGSGPRALTPDEETVIRMVLANLARMQLHGSRSGFTDVLIAKTAIGAKEKRVLDGGYDTLSTWGLLGPGRDGVRAPGAPWKYGEVVDLILALGRAGCLEESWKTASISGQDRTWREFSLSERGSRVMRQAEPDFRMVFPHAERLLRATRPVSSVPQGPAELLSRLRDARSRLAQKADVPLYVIASNKTLEAIADTMPRSRKELLEVPGMGPVKAARYGETFLEVLRQWDRG